jgi:calcineurin-like phosphoesterase family protein
MNLEVLYMGKIYFTSDTHFSQQRTLEMSRRPFPNANMMDTILIRNWNKTVGPDDIIYHLGDFGDYKIKPHLNGRMILIKGNYERSGFKREFEMYSHYFEEVYEYMHSIDYNYMGKTYHINMVHEPKRLPDKHIDKSHINLFGHVHKLCMIKPYGINVGTDCHNFLPVDFETILFYHNQILTYYDDEVFY